MHYSFTLANSYNSHREESRKDSSLWLPLLEPRISTTFPMESGEMVSLIAFPKDRVIRVFASLAGVLHVRSNNISTFLIMYLPTLLFLRCSYIVSLAQVMTRMKLNWCGQQKGTAAASKTWTYILLLFVGYIISDQSLDVLMIHYGPKEQDVNDNGEVIYSPQWWALYGTRVALRFCFFLYFLVLTIRTRQTIREKYEIPTKECSGCEDCW